MKAKVKKEPALIKAVKATYNEETHLSLLEQINPTYGIDCLVDLLVADKWTLYNVIINEKVIGIFVIRLEKQVDDTMELVILHAVSKLRQDIPFVVIIEPLIDDIAKKSKCKKIHICSDTAAMNRLIERHNPAYKVLQTIYSKDVNDVE